MLSKKNRCFYSRKINKPCNHERCKFKNIRNKLILRFLMDTGARVSEISNLKVTDLQENEIKGIIHNGKGNKDREFFPGKNLHANLWEFIKKF